MGWEGPLEEGMATRSSILAWRIPRTEELVGYGSQSHSQTRLSTHTLPPFSLLPGSMSFAIRHCSFSHHQAESESPPLEHEPALLQPKEGSRSGPSLVVQWLRLPAPSAGDWCLIPGQRTRCHKPQLRPGAGLPWWLCGKESTC